MKFHEKFKVSSACPGFSYKLVRVHSAKEVDLLRVRFNVHLVVLKWTDYALVIIDLSAHFALRRGCEVDLEVFSPKAY